MAKKRKCNHGQVQHAPFVRTLKPVLTFGKRNPPLTMSNKRPCPSGAAAAIAKGDKMPDVTLDKGFPPQKVPLSKIIGGKKVVMVGLPGAFTPT